MKNKDTLNVLVAMLPERQDWVILNHDLGYTSLIGLFMLKAFD